MCGYHCPGQQSCRLPAHNQQDCVACTQLSLSCEPVLSSPHSPNLPQLLCPLTHFQDDHDSALDEGDEQEAAVESVADAEGVTDGDYNRAQRFKKLHRMLASSIVQKPIARLKRHAAAVMIGLTLVHLGMFVVMFQGIEKLKKEANGLELIGKAAISSTGWLGLQQASCWWEHDPGGRTPLMAAAAN